MSSRSGLTLLEVLASLVLLTLLVANATPLLRSTARTLGEPATAPDVAGLADLADALVADPAAFGFEERLPAEGSVSDPTLGSARFRVLALRGSGLPHEWVAVEASGATVFRWMEVKE